MNPLRTCTIALAASLLMAADWPEWRGPHRDGVLASEPVNWPEKLNLKWKVEVGEGHASPIFANGSVFLIARQGEQETILSIDPSDGKVRWRQQYPAPYKVNSAAEAHGPGPKSTPLYSGGRLYTLGISGILSCFDAATGKPLWRNEFSKQYKETSPDFGTAMSPIISDGLLIAHVGGVSRGALTAFDPATGAEKWRWDGDPPAYSSPIVVEFGGVKQVVTQTRKNIVGIDEATGKLLWKISFSTAYEQNIVTPVLYKDTLIFSGVDKGVFAVRLLHRGDTWTPETVWQNKDVSMYMNSPVLSGDSVYGFSHLKKGQLFCLDARTGATLWTGPPRAGDNAAILAGPSTLLALIPDGQLIVAKPSAKALGEIHRYEVASSPTWAHPVILDDGLLIKDAKTLARWSFQ